MTHTEALKLALKAVESKSGGMELNDLALAVADATLQLRAAIAQHEPFNPDWDRVKALEESLREHMVEIHRLKALAQPEQEPVAYRFQSPATEEWLLGLEPPVGSRWEIEPLYAAPPQRKPLTDDQIAEICMDCSLVTPSDIYFARAIEAAHGIGEKT